MKTFKQTTLLLTGLLMLALTSCKKTDLTPAGKSISTVDAQNASINKAVPFNDQTNIDLTSGYYEINSCTGEHLHITSGTWHIDWHGTINNNNVSLTQHTNTRNYKLVSLTTGIEYTGSYASYDNYNVSLSNGLYKATITVSVLLTTAGGDNNSVLKMDQHVTIDANGNVTALLDNFRAGCQ